MAAGAQLVVEGIGHSFGGFQVLSKVSFDVPRGGLVGLIGPNGSGKTTLFNIISGFLTPRSGRVLWKDGDLAGRSVEARSRLGLLRTFQTPKVFEHLSVLENVMAGLYKQTSSGMVQAMLQTPKARREMQQMAQSAQTACEAFGLAPFSAQVAGKLTAGQRRNLELARAQVSRPELLMLDEPSSGLSQQEVEGLKQSLATLNQGGLSILLVTHDMELMAVAQCVHVLSAGQIIASGSMQEMQRHPQVQQVYLGM